MGCREVVAGFVLCSNTVVRLLYEILVQSLSNEVFLFEASLLQISAIRSEITPQSRLEKMGGSGEFSQASCQEAVEEPLGRRSWGSSGCKKHKAPGGAGQGHTCLRASQSSPGWGRHRNPAPAHRQQRVLGKKLPRGHDGVQAVVVWMPPILCQGEARLGRVCPANRSS